MISWIDRAVDNCLDWLKRGSAGYNQYISQHLPFTRRTGRILRKQYWDIDSEEKEWMLKELTKADLDTLKIIVELSESEVQTIFQNRMTSGIFFDCCKMGYEANGYSFDTELKSADLYRKFADGRDFGLGQLDLDSSEAFEEWFEQIFDKPLPIRGDIAGKTARKGTRLGLDRCSGSCYLCLSKHLSYCFLSFYQFFPIFKGRHVVQRLMGPFFVVVFPPGFGQFPDFRYVAENISIKNSSSVASVEAFNVTVLSGFARLNINDVNLIAFAPIFEHLSDKLRAIVAAYVLWFAIQPYDLFQNFNDPFCRHGHRYLLCHGNLAGIIYDIKNTELSSALNPVTDKVNGPGNIGLFRHNQRILHSCRQTFLQTASLLIVHCLVNPVNLLVVPCLTLTSQP